jgi:hypothetical protein
MRPPPPGLPLSLSISPPLPADTNRILGVVNAGCLSLALSNLPCIYFIYAVTLPLPHSQGGVSFPRRERTTTIMIRLCVHAGEGRGEGVQVLIAPEGDGGGISVSSWLFCILSPGVIVYFSARCHCAPASWAEKGPFSVLKAFQYIVSTFRCCRVFSFSSRLVCCYAVLIILLSVRACSLPYSHVDFMVQART